MLSFCFAYDYQIFQEEVKSDLVFFNVSKAF